MIVGTFLAFTVLAVYNFHISGRQIEEAQTGIQEEDSREERAVSEEEKTALEEDPETALYSIDLYYNSGELSERGINVVDGSPPNKALEKFIDPVNSYTAKTLSDQGEVLDVSRFDLGLFAYDFGYLEETYLTLQLLYFPEGKTIEIYDPEGALKLLIDVSGFLRPELVKKKEPEKPVEIVRLAFEKHEWVGDSIPDLSGNSNNGRLQFKENPDAQCEAGKRSGKGVFGQSMFFDGLRDFLVVDETKNFTGIKSFSVSGWIYPVSFEGEGQKTLFSKGLYNLTITKDKESAENKIKFSVYSENNSVEIDSLNSVSANSWLSVAGVWDGEKLKLYLNGTLDSEQDFKGITGFPESQNPLYIGSLPYLENPAENQLVPFNGFIDDVRIFRGALSQEDIEELFSAANSDPAKIYPIKHRLNMFSFEEQENNIITDSVTNTSIGTTNIMKTPAVFGNAADIGQDRLELPVSIEDQNSFSVDMWVNISSLFLSDTLDKRKPELKENILEISGIKEASGEKQGSSVFANTSGLGVRSSNFSGDPNSTNTDENFYLFEEGEYLNLSLKWSHLAVVFEKSDNATKGTVYLDGQMKAQIEHGFFSQTNPAVILSGMVDEVSVYEKPLGVLEITKLSKRKPPQKPELPLRVSQFLESKEKYVCEPVTLTGIIRSKDACLECEAQEDPCICENKVIELGDADKPEKTLSVKFLKDDMLYRSLKEGSDMLVSVRQEADEVVYNRLIGKE